MQIRSITLCISCLLNRADNTSRVGVGQATWPSRKYINCDSKMITCVLLIGVGTAASEPIRTHSV
jgi:hypothetical protein